MSVRVIIISDRRSALDGPRMRLGVHQCRLGDQAPPLNERAFTRTYLRAEWSPSSFKPRNYCNCCRETIGDNHVFCYFCRRICRRRGRRRAGSIVVFCYCCRRICRRRGRRRAGSSRYCSRRCSSSAPETPSVARAGPRAAGPRAGGRRAAGRGRRGVGKSGWRGGRLWSSRLDRGALECWMSQPPPLL
jgi:hypothetical protein